MDVDFVGVATDDQGRMRGNALRTALDAAGDGVFAVVATAGTTNFGIVDRIDEIADVCAERDVWLHIDGAYGGAALCAPTVRDRFRGVERCNSFIVDPHKWLSPRSTAAPCSTGRRSWPAPRTCRRPATSRCSRARRSGTRPTTP